MSRSKRSKAAAARSARLAPDAPRGARANKVFDEPTRLLVRAAVARGKTRGWTSARIVEQIEQDFGISMVRQNVDYYWRSIVQEAVDRQTKDVDQLLAVQVMRVDRIVEAAWDAWEKSAAPKEITSARERTVARDEKGQPLGRASDLSDTMARTETRDPDPKYIQAIIRAEELRSRLLGLLRKPEDDDSDKLPPPTTFNVTVKGDANFTLGQPTERTSLPPQVIEGEIIDPAKFAPALGNGHVQTPGEYR